MREGTKKMGVGCFVLLIALSLPGPRAWADAGSGRADVLCAKAEKAEREAKDYERKSEQRQRFLKGKGGTASRNDTLPTGGDSAAIRQSVKARLSEVRALLPQLRQGAAAAAQDRGVVPGLSQFFARMESNLSRMLQAADACLDAPQFCSVPSVSCPPVPAMPSFNHTGSAAFIRQVQQSYVQSANQFRQACQNLDAGILGDVERLKRESRAAGTMGGLPGIAPPQPFGDTDLYLRRSENLRREASQYRLEADRASGVRGYCGARSYVRMDAKSSRAIVESFKAAERPRKPAADFPLDAEVIDLKAEWEKKWNKGTTLKASDVPLPKLTVGEEGESEDERIRNRLKDYVDDGGPGWLRDVESAYQEADRQMELTEFIKSRPKELLKDVATEIVEKSLGAYGKTVTTGYKIMSAVKTTGDEVGEILTDAPRVLAGGSLEEARELYRRTQRVPLNFMNNVFGDFTGWFPPERFDYQYKGGAGR
ncbi:MAG: hypothetical protein CO109_09660 [Deltaproteobacteria bacterium CG_4_9_14_3_um_filter_65_9]|nr:MAG: hypothetical protein CO109_09660 [Deltaproteobacteria bacterium CG_4_9_14_3_um_filter_65_9]